MWAIADTRRALAVLLMTALVVVALPIASQAASGAVAIKDNEFTPREIRIDPGDSVIWTNQGARVHTVTADNRSFDSGDIKPGGTFSRRFEEEGYYFYYCKQHGAAGGVGMWGVVIVGDPPPSPRLEEKTSGRPKIVVPDDAPTIQKAVNQARPGATVLIRPGVYHETVTVRTPNLVIKGVDRFRTILHGRDKLGNGIVTDGTRNITVKNMTIRNYTGNGIFFNNTRGYKAERIDSIKNRTYGIYAFDSHNGIIRNSFGWGSGDSAFYVGECMACSALIENVHAEMNFIGYSGTNATGVVIRDSTWVRNGAGIVPNTLPTEDLGPNRGTWIVNNIVRNNNYETIPAAGVSETFAIPFGTGIWLLQTENNVAHRNIVTGHKRYGILISHGLNGVPMNNRVIANKVRNSGKYDLAWDGTGASNCFARNDFTGETGPPEIETIYDCDNRPYPGIPFAPIQADLYEAITVGYATREQKEPPEPKRPHCQRCHRHKTRSKTKDRTGGHGGHGASGSSQDAPEVPLFAGGGTQLTNGFFFPGTALVVNGKLEGQPYEIQQGSNIRFVNIDGTSAPPAHSIRSQKTTRRGMPLFRSKRVDAPGEALVVTSHLKPGTYTYYCPIHYGMFGFLKVVK
jgi:plastocyanin